MQGVLQSAAVVHGHPAVLAPFESTHTAEHVPLEQIQTGDDDGVGAGGDGDGVGVRVGVTLGVGVGDGQKPPDCSTPLI